MLRRERPGYRVAAYLGLAAVLATAHAVAGVPIVWVALIYVVFGGAETSITTVRMVRRVRSTR